MDFIDILVVLELVPTKCLTCYTVESIVLFDGFIIAVLFIYI